MSSNFKRFITKIKKKDNNDSLKVFFNYKKKIHKTIFGATFKEKIGNKKVVVKLSSLKKLYNILQKNKDRVENPIRECNIMKNITPHPHLCLAKNNFIDDDNHYIIFDYIPKGDLIDFLNLRGYISEGRAKVFIRQLLSAIKHLHSHNIAHLDISAENILIDKNNKIQLCDFGMAQKTNNGILTIKKCQEIPGKEHIRSPEIKKEIPFNAYQADIYSIGIVGLFMVTGEFLYQKSKKKDKNFYNLFYKSLRYRLNEMYLDFRISNECIDFFSHIVCPLKKRWKIKDLEKHIWLKNNL